MKLKDFLLLFLIGGIVNLNIIILVNFNFQEQEMNLTTESKLTLSTGSNLHFYNWYKKWDSGLQDNGKGICVNNDSLYITGYNYNSDIQKSEAIIIQYDKLGNKLWEHKWGDDLYCTSIKTDNQSNLYTTGWKYISNEPSEADFMLIKINNSKQEEWKKEWGTAEHERLNDITLDSFGDIYVVGERGNSIILQKYKNNGSLIWEESWIDPSSYVSGKIAIDSANNVYVTGMTNSDQDSFIVKYTSSGSLAWYKTFGAVNLSVLAFDIVVDHNDYIYVCGILKIPLSSPGTYDNDVFIAKFNSFSQQIWNETWGGSGDDYGQGIDVDSNGNLYVTGWTTSFGYKDCFILKYDSEGIKTWSNVLDFSVDDYSYDLVVDSLDNIFMVGNTFNFDNRKDILVVGLSSVPPANQIPGYEILLLIIVFNITFMILGYRNLNLIKKKEKAKSYYLEI